MDFVRAKCNAVCRAIYAAVVRGSPPEPCDYVQDLFEALMIPKRQQLMMYTVFHDLRQSERSEVVKTAVAVKFKSICSIIPARRRWVENLLQALLNLGGCTEEEVSWDSFLYILLQFCSLSKVELCQALFLIVLKCLDSRIHHYLTMEQLVEFYSFYAKCPVTSFNTRAIDFTRLPLRRYYVQDFCELVQRFTVLLNPVVHLQRSLQESLPSVEFWDNHNRSEVIVRKVTYDFFLMEKSRCFVWGEPPFRESCEMLAPEALGFLTCNKDQWDLRTFDLHERVGALSEGGSMSKDGKLMAPPGYQYRSLRQYSVWGEQTNPEDTEKMMLEENVNVFISDSGYIHKKAERDLEQGQVTNENEKGEKGGKGKGKGKGKIGRKRRAMEALAMQPQELDPLSDPTSSCLRAACTDEERNPPPEDMPPSWMKAFAVAPAPRFIGADPPLRKPQVPGPATQEGFYASATTFGASQMGGMSPKSSFAMNQVGGMSQMTASKQSKNSSRR